MTDGAAGWTRSRLRIDDPEARATLAAIVAERLGCAVEEAAGAVVVYLPDGSGETSLDAIRAEARRLGIADDIEREHVPGRDWTAAWKAGLAPRRIGRAIVVTPTWIDPEAAPGDTVISIDPQMAFGTGEHPTTRGCLRLLEGRVHRGARVLDVGSGSGVLAIAAALLGAAEVIAVEHDPDANLNARENLERNGVAERVQLVEAMADARSIEALGRFDLVTANILSSVITPLLPPLGRALRADGTLVVSGILREESDDVAHAAAGAGLRVVEVDEEGEWWSAALAWR